MTRLEELTLKLTDDALSDAEACELESLLTADPEASAAHCRLLELEAALRGQREFFDLAAPTLVRLRSQLAVSLERGVMQRLQNEPPPAWTRASTLCPHLATERGEGQGEGFPKHRVSSPRPSSPNVGRRGSISARVPQPFWNRPVMLVLAVSVLIFVGLASWYFGPTVGLPEVAEVGGPGASIVRDGKTFAAIKGALLQPGDVLKTAPTSEIIIAYGKENTRITNAGGSELKLLAWQGGKRFLLTSGKLEASVARQRPFHPMIIKTPQAEARVLGTEFTLATTASETRLEVTEGKVRLTCKSDGAAVKVGPGNHAVVAAGYELAAQPITGKILREYWTNLPGDFYITYLTSHRNFPHRPSGREYLDKFESPTPRGTNYGARLYGFLHPPKSGDYTFWIAAGGGASFFLSPDDHPENKQQLACASGVSPHQWTKDPGQESPALTLVAGRKYFIEVLQKQGAKLEDHLAVAWQGPGRSREVIPGEFLSPLNPKSKVRE